MKNTKKKKSSVPKDFKFGTPVMVTWKDTTGFGGWHSLHEGPLKPITVFQVGMFISQDEDAIHLCQGLPDDEEGCQVVAPTTIPRGCVIGIRALYLKDKT